MTAVVNTVANTAARKFTPETRYLLLGAYNFQRSRRAAVHLARVKSTSKPVTAAWCGAAYWVMPGKLTGEEALLMAWADEHPTCHRCLAKAGAWDWEPGPITTKESCS